MRTDYEYAKKIARKHALQLKAEGSRLRNNLNKVLGDSVGIGLEFLNMDESFALWKRIEEKELDSIDRVRKSGGVVFEVETSIDCAVSELSEVFSSNIDEFGFFFGHNWNVSGVSVVNSRVVFESLDKISYIFDDQLAFYSQKLTEAFIFSGDRLSDKLYTLEVAVYGPAWQKLIDPTIKKFRSNQAG